MFYILLVCVCVGAWRVEWNIPRSFMQPADSGGGGEGGDMVVMWCGGLVYECEVIWTDSAMFKTSKL